MGIPFIRPSIVAYNGYDSGLGNRMRVVLGAKSLARLENRDLVYVWPTGALFGPKLSQLWNMSGTTVSRSVSRVMSRVFPYENETLTWITDAKRREHVWQIRTGSPIQLPPDAESWEAEFRGLEPIAAIADAVHSIFDKHLRGEPYVGVMIRAHAVSHRKTLDASPVEWFLDRMRRQQAEVPGTRFYLSCDVPEVQDRIMAEIPGCVGQRDKGAYNSTAGVRSAVIDLYLLASSGHLLGPHWSSFVHLAEYLAGDRLTFETAVTSPGPVDYRTMGIAEDPLVPSRRA